jgi:hypothetical protein
VHPACPTRNLSQWGERPGPRAEHFIPFAAGGLLLVSGGLNGRHQSANFQTTFPPLISLHDLKELRNLKRQRRGNSLNVDQADVAASSLDVAQIGAMDSGPVGKFLLCQTQRFPSALDGKPKALADVRRGPFFHCLQANVCVDYECIDYE